MRYGVQRPIPQYVRGVVKWGTRFGTPVQAVVIHRVEGTLDGADSWLRNSASGSATTHFGIGFGNWMDRLLKRNVQTWQWVDTANAAFGWAATPTDIPTPTLLRIFGKYLTRQGGFPYYRSNIDLNRPVIAIEVEGHHDKPFDPRFIPPLQALLRAIAAAHGPLYVLTHTDASSKPCPGLGYFMAAMPGYYGNRLSTGIPDTSIETGDLGLPSPWKPRHRTGYVPKGVNIRAGDDETAKVFIAAPHDGQTWTFDGVTRNRQGEVWAFSKRDRDHWDGPVAFVREDLVKWQ